MATPATRVQRLRQASIRLPIRTPAGDVTTIDLWREDRIEFDYGNGSPPATYLVLDFGLEEGFRGGEWQSTDRFGIVVQQLDPDDPDAAVSKPSLRHVHHRNNITVRQSNEPAEPDESGQIDAWIAEAEPWAPVIHHPVSPRRG